MSRHQTNSPPVTIASVREHGDTLLPVLYLMVIAALLIKDAPRPVVTEDKAPIAKVEKAPIAKKDKSETASPQADDNGKPGSAPSVLPASPPGLPRTNASRANATAIQIPQSV